MLDDSISELKEIMAGDFPAADILRDPCNFEMKEWISHGLSVNQLVIKSEQAAQLLEKAPGTYVTVLTGLLDQDNDVDNISACLSEPLRDLLAPYFGGTLLICGLGNPELVVDSLGPETVRRLPLKAVEDLSDKSEFTRIAAISPGVKWNTNLDAAEWISGIAAAVSATCVLLIDSMVCERYNKLCATIQLSNTGLSSHNSGRLLNNKTIGIPAIAIGIPTIVQADAIIGVHTGDTKLTISGICNTVKTAAYAIAAAILKATDPELDGELVKALVEHNLIW